MQRWSRRSTTLCRAAVAVVPLLVGALSTGHAAPRRTLRVCADPNNLPFSSDSQPGFENRLAALIAEELDADVAYTWWAQRRGFIRNTLDAGRCDVVMGVPAGHEQVLTTKPYYRSSYVFVTRRDRRLDLTSLDDPRLHELKLGVHVIGDDYANAPPAHALARRGIVNNLVGYSIYGDYREDSPPARLVRAVATGEIDAALAWGPLAGYVAKQSEVKLSLTPISPARDAGLPLAFDIALGVRKGDRALKRELERVLTRRRTQIRKLLARYGVPVTR